MKFVKKQTKKTKQEIEFVLFSANDLSLLNRVYVKLRFEVIHFKRDHIHLSKTVFVEVRVDDGNPNLRALRNKKNKKKTLISLVNMKNLI